MKKSNILWITGNSGSGKTTLANYLSQFYDDPALLDGDEVRKLMKNKDLSKAGRWEHNLNIARMTLILEGIGHQVIVSVICPYEKLRQEVKNICNCEFIYLTGGKTGKEYPYEIPKHPDYIMKGNEL